MEPAGQPAQSLSPDNPKFPQKVRDILHKAQSAWLKNTEVCDLLLHYAEYNLPVARDPPNLPPGKLQGFYVNFRTNDLSKRAENLLLILWLISSRRLFISFRSPSCALLPKGWAQLAQESRRQDC